MRHNETGGGGHGLVVMMVMNTSSRAAAAAAAFPLCTGTCIGHGSAAEMPCGSDCIHWRCWWLPLPSHFFFLLPFLLLHRCVTRLQIGGSRQVFVCCACSFQLLLVL